MAEVTSTGVEPQTLSGFRTLLQAAFQDALGPDLDQSVESPQGQLIGNLSLMLSQVDEAVVAIANGLALPRAIGVQLDDLGSLLGIDRRHATHSSVTATLTGTANTVVPAGSRARTTAGDLFALSEDATIASGGTVDATMRAVEAGPVEAAAATLTSIVDLVGGWTAVTNAAAASAGRFRESDVAYRARFQRFVARNARSSEDAILAAVLAVDGVTDAIIRENATGSSVTVQTVTIAARSFLVIADGGTDADVAAAIARAKPVGVPMSGAESVDVAHSSGSHTVTIQFSRVDGVPLKVVIDTTLGSGFPGDGATQIVQRVADWAAGGWRSGAGDFDTSGIAIGEALDTNRLLSPVLSVPGHVVQTVTVTRKVGGAAAGTPALNERFTIAAADVSVT